MIKIGSKVRYIGSGFNNESFQKDLREYNGIFEVIAADPHSSTMFVKSEYNIRRTIISPINGHMLSDEKYWHMSLSDFKEVADIDYTFNETINEIIKI